VTNILKQLGGKNAAHITTSAAQCITITKQNVHPRGKGVEHELRDLMAHLIQRSQGERPTRKRVHSFLD
jgi:hypothetical protein